MNTLPKAVFFSSVIAITLFFFVSPSRGVERSSRDAYVSASIGDARVLIPFLASDVPSSAICSLVFNGLTKVDRDLNIVGDLAERWEISPDNRTLTFYLRQGITWHDGTPVSAEDVKFTFDAMRDPRNGCPYIDSYQDIADVRVLDARTVQFAYRQPYAPALLKLGAAIIPRHLLSGEDLRKTAFKRNPVGTGPYVFEQWKTDEHIILRAYPSYFEHKPYIERCVTRVIPDQSIQYLELVGGGIDSMELTPYQYRYRSSAPRFTSQFNKYSFLAHAYTYVGYNMADPLFADVRVRQALSFAIDRRTIIDGVLFGLGESCTGPFLKGTAFYDESAPRYDYDPSKAEALLTAAGWIDRDNDGIRDKDGVPFVFTLTTNQGNKVREDVAVLIQEQWRRIGVVCRIQTVAWAAFINEFIDKRNFQAVILGWTIPLDPDCYNVWHSAADTQSGLNFVGYHNGEVDDLIMQGRRTFDPAERSRIYRRIHRLVAADAPYTFLFFPYTMTAVHVRFRGIEPAPAGIGYNFIDWYVEPDQTRYTLE